MMIECWYHDWWTHDSYDILCYVDFKTYVLCMIPSCYVLYVMIVGHA